MCPVFPDGATQDALLGISGSAYTVTLSEAGGIVLDSLDLNSADATLPHSRGVLTANTVELQSGVYTLSGGIIQDATVNVSGGIFRAASNNNNTLSNVTFLGDLVLDQPNGRLRLQGGTTVSGDIVVSGGGDTILAILQSSTFQNRFDLSGDGADLSVSGNNTLTFGNLSVVGMTGAQTVLRSDALVTGNSILINQGLIIADGNGDAGDNLGRFITADSFSNQGTINVLNNAHMFLQSPTITNAGTIEVATGSSLDFGSASSNWDNSAGAINVASGADLNLNGNFTTAGLGAINNSGGTVRIQGTWDNTGDAFVFSPTTGSYLLDGGTVRGGSLTQTAADRLDFLSNNSSTLDGVSVVGDLVLDQVNGRLRLQGGTTVSGDIVVSGGGNTFLAILQTGTFQNRFDLSGDGADLSVSGNNTLTLGNLSVVDMTGAQTELRSDLFVTGNSILINQGLIIADGNGDSGNNRRRFITADSFLNQGTVRSSNGADFWMTPGTLQNLSANTLTGGTWEVGPGSTLDIVGGLVSTLDATVSLEGAGSSFVSSGSDTPLESSLGTIGASGLLRILDGRAFNGIVPLENRGGLELGGAGLAGGTFDSPSPVTNTATGEIFGHGVVSDTILNSGVIRAHNGVLTVLGIIDGQSGTIQVDPGATLDLSGASGDSDADFLVHNGSPPGSLSLGANSITVNQDYTNANFSSGNSFDARANVSGTGSILAGGDASQSLGGDVADGATTTPSLNFGNVRIGDASTLNYTVSNQGSTGPAIRGAIQTDNTAGNGGNITDPQLSGAGVTAANFGPVAAGGATANLGVTYTPAGRGPISGQQVAVVNNFDNLDTQVLSITGTGYEIAGGETTPLIVDYGNVHVGDGVGPTAINVTNTATAGIYSEDLLATFTPGGDAQLGGGAPGAVTVIAGTTNSEGRVTLNTAVAGARTGTLLVNYTSTGEVASVNVAGLDPIAVGSDTINLEVDVFRLANPTRNAPPEPVDLGNFHVGDVITTDVSFTNDNPNDGFSENLDIGLGGVTGDASQAGPVDNLAPGAITTVPTVNLNSATAGNKAGTATFTLTSDGAGSSGLGLTALANEVVTATASVFRLANPSTLSPDPIDFGNVRQSSTPLQTLTVSNIVAADAFSESLNVSISGVSGDATGSGTVLNLAPGASDSTNLVAGLDTSDAGLRTGSIEVGFASDGAGSSGLGVTPLGTQLVDVTGNVIRPAVSSGLPDSVDFGIVRVGDGGGTVTEQLSVSNDSAADGFSENLVVAALDTSDPSIVASGTTAPLAPDAVSNALEVGVNTSEAGLRSGTVTFTTASNGSSFGFGTDLDLGDEIVAVVAQVNYLAMPELVGLGGNASFSQGSGILEIDFGAVDPDSGVFRSQLAVENRLLDPFFQDALSGSFGPEILLGFTGINLDAFVELAPGDRYFFEIEFDSAMAPGVYQSTLILETSSVNSSDSVDLTDLQIRVRGEIIPEPGTVVWIPALLLGLLRRRRTTGRSRLS